jgi:hypothetical protein
MFAHTRIKKSELEFLHFQVNKLEEELKKEHGRYLAEINYSMKLQQRCVDYCEQLNALENELTKYKQLYADELQKRLELAKEVKELESKVEDNNA